MIIIIMFMAVFLTDNILVWFRWDKRILTDKPTPGIWPKRVVFQFSSTKKPAYIFPTVKRPLRSSVVKEIFLEEILLKYYLYGKNVLETIEI